MILNKGQGRPMANITISSAIRQINALKKKISDCDNNMQDSVWYDESTPPVYDFNATYSKRAEYVRQMLSLQTRMAVANATTRIKTPDGQEILLAEAVRILSEFRGEIAQLKILKTQAKDRIENHKVNWIPDEHDYSKRVKEEVTTVFICKLPQAAKAELIENLQNKHDALNDVVEYTNNQTTLPEL